VANGKGVRVLLVAALATYQWPGALASSDRGRTAGAYGYTVTPLLRIEGGSSADFSSDELPATRSGGAFPFDLGITANWPSFVPTGRLQNMDQQNG
jgi:hypothetical protein